MGKHGLKGYTQAFRNAGLGEKFNDRARVARVADLWPQRFERVNQGLGSERIALIDMGQRIKKETKPGIRRVKRPGR